MVGHGGSSAGSYLADPTSPIPSHCASIVATSTLRAKVSFWHIPKMLTCSASFSLLLTLSLVIVFCLQVLVWKTNFDQIDYNEVLQSHKSRVRGETAAPPTIRDIPPRAVPKPQVTKVTKVITCTFIVLLASECSPLI